MLAKMFCRMALALLAAIPSGALAQESHYAQRSELRQRDAAASSPTAPLKLAPRSAGGKRPDQRPAPATPATAISTVISSLAIVLGLFMGLVWFSKRVGPGGATPLPKEAVESLGRTTLAGRQPIELIRVGDRLLLVAFSAGTAQTLTEITDAAEVERLTGLCRQGRADSATASFGRVLGQLASEPLSQPSRSRTRGAA